MLDLTKAIMFHCNIWKYFQGFEMEIYDRDHRQSDPWKKREGFKKFKYNESKGDIEFDRQQKQKLWSFK